MTQDNNCAENNNFLAVLYVTKMSSLIGEKNTQVIQQKVVPPNEAPRHKDI